MKVVINKCYGGFGLSKEAYIRYAEIKGTPVWIEEDHKFKSLGLFTVWTVPPEQRPESKEDSFYEMSMEERKAYNESYSSNTIHCRDIERNDPALVKAVEELGDKANGKHAKLDVIEIPDGIDFEVEEYDGKEWVSEKHRTWY